MLGFKIGTTDFHGRERNKFEKYQRLFSSIQIGIERISNLFRMNNEIRSMQFVERINFEKRQRCLNFNAPRVEWQCDMTCELCNKITYVEIHIFLTKYSINFRSAVRLKLKWIKRNKLWMPMKTVQPHSVNVSISPQAEIKNADWAKHVSAINTIKKCDQNKYMRPNKVDVLVSCSGQAPLNFNMTHCDGNENVLSFSFGNGLNIIQICLLIFSRKWNRNYFPPKLCITLIYRFDSHLAFKPLKLKVVFTIVSTILECDQIQWWRKFL